MDGIVDLGEGAVAAALDGDLGVSLTRAYQRRVSQNATYNHLVLEYSACMLVTLLDD